MQNDLFYIRRVLGNSVDYVVAEGFFLIVPIETGTQLVGRILHETRKYMFAGRRNGRIGERGNDHINVRTPREVAVLGVIVGPLHVLDTGRDRDGAAQVRAGARQAFEVRQRIQRKIHLTGGPPELITVNFLKELNGKIALINELRECEPRIHAGRNRIRVNLVSIRENNTLGLALLHDDLCNSSLSANLRARFPCCISDCIRDRARAAASKTPRAKCAVNLPHVVVKQNVRRPRRAHAQKCSDDPGS